MAPSKRKLNRFLTNDSFIVWIYCTKSWKLILFKIFVLCNHCCHLVSGKRTMNKSRPSVPNQDWIIKNRIILLNLNIRINIDFGIARFLQYWNKGMTLCFDFQIMCGAYISSYHVLVLILFACLLMKLRFFILKSINKFDYWIKVELTFWIIKFSILVNWSTLHVVSTLFGIFFRRKKFFVKHVISVDLRYKLRISFSLKGEGHTIYIAGHFCKVIIFL